MNSKLKLMASIAFAVALFFGASQTVNAQYGNHCHHSGYPAYRASYGYGYGNGYGYGYSNPYGGYSSYAAYPAYSTYYAPRVYSGTSLYVGPGYTTARVVVPPVYPAYRPAIVATPYGPMPGVRIGF